MCVYISICVITPQPNQITPKPTRRWLGLAGAKTEQHQQECVDSDGGGKTDAHFRAVAGSAALAVGVWGAGRALALSWLDSLATWVEATGPWAAGEKATVQMDEVRTHVWKDGFVRSSILL